MGIEQRIKTECLVIGNGLGGYAAALELAKAGKRVLIIDKGEGIENTSSRRLAGGFNSVSDQSIRVHGDSIDVFVEDTIRNGANFNCGSVVRSYGERFYPDVIQFLEGLGIKFDQGLHAEGSNTARVHHISDHTGRDVMAILDGEIKKNKNITIMNKHMAFDLITNNWINGVIKESDVCRAVYTYSIDDDLVKTIEADMVVVGAGSVGGVFPAASTSPTATGDGIAMAIRAYLPIAMMEMLQFHPTGLATPGYGEKPLCTQALRGAGAFLKLRKDDTEDFIRTMGYNTELGSNADRATVSRAIIEMIQKLAIKEGFVWLDCSTIPANKLKKEFSDFYTNCIQAGYDPTKEPVPVKPILHYCNGGVLVGMNGETLYEGGRGISRLYFVGENAYTGLHGADRFPSNSGPEAILTGRLAAHHYLNNKHAPKGKKKVPIWRTGNATEQKDRLLMQQYYVTQIQTTMGLLCGILRNEEKLIDGKAVLATLRKQIHAFYRRYLVDQYSLTARNMLDVANVIFDSALMRNSSVGCHYRTDYPHANPNHRAWTIVQKERVPYFMPIPK